MSTWSPECDNGARTDKAKCTHCLDLQIVQNISSRRLYGAFVGRLSCTTVSKEIAEQFVFISTVLAIFILMLCRGLLFFANRHSHVEHSPFSLCMSSYVGFCFSDELSPWKMTISPDLVRQFQCPQPEWMRQMRKVLQRGTVTCQRP